MFDSDREHVAWDIETTGFAWDDTVTVSGFWWPHSAADLILNTGGEAVDEAALATDLERASGATVTVHVADDEAVLLDQMGELLFDRFDRNYNRLIAYHGETWKSGFDHPFLRTRCLKHGRDWIFDGIQYADLWDAVKKRLNTTHAAYDKSVEVNTLVGSHAILFDGLARLPDALTDAAPVDHTWYRTVAYDPFVDSGSAAAAHRDGDFLPLLKHNLADIHRTWELGEVVREYVSPKDLSGKKL